MKKVLEFATGFGIGMATVKAVDTMMDSDWFRNEKSDINGGIKLLTVLGVAYGVQFGLVKTAQKLFNK